MAPKRSRMGKKSDSSMNVSKTKRKNSSKKAFRGVVDDDDASLKPLDHYEESLSDEENFEALGLPKSFTPEISDDEAYEDQDEGSEEEDEEEDRVDWGKKLKNYYVDGSDDDSDEEAINDRIEEAKKIASELYENVDDEDADIDNYDVEDHKEDPVEFDTLLKSLSESLNAQREASELPEDFFDLSDRDKKEFLSNEHPEFLELLREFKEKSDISNEQIMKILSAPDSLKLCTKDGMEYLDIRNELLLMYVSYLTYYLLLKTHGISIENHPVINRLLELRIMLDKAKPIESRLQYQITKLLEDKDYEVDTTQLRSRLDLMEDEEDQSAVYKPPKNAVMGEVSGNMFMERTGKPSKDEMRERKRQSYLEGEENGESDVLATKAAKFMKKMAERERYEMESMRRLPMNKKAKREMRMFAREQKNLLSGCSLQHLSSFASDAMKTSGKTLSASAGLNAAAQRMRQNILISEGKNIAHASSISTHGKDKSHNKDEAYNPAPKLTFDDEITRIQGLHAKEKSRKNTKILKLRSDEIVPGKRDIGKDIMKNKGLTVKRDKTKGNARVSNRKKFEKKQKVFNAVNASRRSEGSSYSGEDTGINARKKKSLTM
ncbi:conserved hypothetical protein [Theileria equi strain WA]|uniref:Sas10 C-terminal domain-containing protein n=1 Tax=Theileria equi strain WA TaxID=1537102 RepID=L1LEM6_THEEQ|nr:conserved hypothetical protein [Theileria equi strain WA]EKX73776.1 conserved hypothetical protein [Theileria equi strain WA]|eukprot:XP_004833228.1 conserved hypothetical protein [Theileria equi strain WA]